jgi:hypothetical protein
LAPARKRACWRRRPYRFFELLFFLLELLFFAELERCFDVALAIVWCLDDP